MVTIDDLSPGRFLLNPIVVGVTDVNWNAGKSRRAEVMLVDSNRNPLRLVDYEGANISINWERDYRYRISQCHVSKGGGGYDLELSPSKRTVIEPLGSSKQSRRILVVGDTHVGRTVHPRMGETINPIGAFATAIEYGINRGVDAVIHVGDIFHDSATPLQAARVQQQVFTPLDEARIPFYYVRGNHAAEPGDELLAEMNGKQAANLSATGVSIGSAARVFGINHYPGGRLPWSDLTFPSKINESVSILVLHQTLKQLSGQGEKSVDLDRIQRRFGDQFDLVLSGHHHDAKEDEWRGVPVMYTGASERMSTNNNPIDRVAWLLSVKDESVFCDRYDIP